MARRLADSIASRCERAEAAGTWLIPGSQTDAAALRHHVASGKLALPLPGCFARPSFLDSLSPKARMLTSIRTLARLHPNWVFCSFSAAVLHGLWISNRLIEPIHILRRGSHPFSTDLITRHNLSIDEGEIIEREGIKMTCLSRTLMDCLRHSDLRTALPIVDSALHWNLVTAGELEAYFATRGKGLRGVRRARETLRLADGRSDSGGESVARAVMIELGFQMPDLQVEVFDPLEPGNPKYSDFGWVLANGKVILAELDGFEKYKKAGEKQDSAIKGVITAMRKERRRESHINLTNATVIRFSMEDVFNTVYFQRLLETAGVPKAM